MANQKSILEIFSKMLLTYPRQGVDTDTERDQLLRVWQDVLADADDTALAVAAAEYLKAGHVWRPAPGVLRERALEIAGRDAIALAEAAWLKVIDSDFGRQPIGDDLAVRIMSRLGGFSRLANADDDTAAWIHKEFVGAYARERQRDQVLAFLPEARKLQLLGGGDGHKSG